MPVASTVRLEAGLAVELMVGLLVGGMLARLPPGMLQETSLHRMHDYTDGQRNILVILPLFFIPYLIGKKKKLSLNILLNRSFMLTIQAMSSFDHNTTFFRDQPRPL